MVLEFGVSLTVPSEPNLSPKSVQSGVSAILDTEHLLTSHPTDLKVEICSVYENHFHHFNFKSFDKSQFHVVKDIP
jgi:hypothetical protein